MTNPGLTVVERDSVAVVTIDRPERRNALSLDVLGKLLDALEPLRTRPLRAVVLQGAAGCFSAGADLGELKGSLSDLQVDDAVAAAAVALRTSELPVIAAIEGPCVGAGVELAMACDLRVVSTTAFFVLPAVHLGLLYRPAAVAELAAQLSPALLSRLLLFGERLGAEESVALGIAAGPVTAEAGALDRALELAAVLPEPPSDAVAATKHLLVELRRGADPAKFEDLRRKLLTSPQRVAALAAARERISSARR